MRARGSEPRAIGPVAVGTGVPFRFDPEGPKI